jgi:hypothetical protein
MLTHDRCHIWTRKYCKRNLYNNVRVVVDQHFKLDFHTASLLRQLLVGFAPLGHIIHIPTELSSFTLTQSDHENRQNFRKRKRKRYVTRQLCFYCTDKLQNRISVNVFASSVVDFLDRGLLLTRKLVNQNHNPEVSSFINWSPGL